MSHLSDFIANSLTDSDTTKLVPLSLLEGFAGGLTNFVLANQTSYTCLSTDNGKTIVFNYNNTETTIHCILPEPLPAGFSVDVVNLSVGKIDIQTPLCEFITEGGMIDGTTTPNLPIPNYKVIRVLKQMDSIYYITGDLSNGSSLSGTNYVFVQGKGTPTQNAAELQAAFNTAKNLYDDIVGRATVIVAPGIYTFGTTKFLINAVGVDVVSLTGNADVILDGINITSCDGLVKGIDTGSFYFTIASNLPLLVCENCKGGVSSFVCGGVFSGKAINCVGGSSSFGGDNDGTGGTFSGIAINCSAGGYSFGSGSGAGGTGSFTGTAINCESIDSDCFGGTHMSGKLISCRLTDSDYVFPTVAIGGHITYCINGNGTAATNQ